jgi:hypothetical protein
MQKHIIIMDIIEEMWINIFFYATNEITASLNGLALLFNLLCLFCTMFTKNSKTLLQAEEL